MNPILFREALDRFRGRRAWPFLLIWILGNGVVVYLMLIAATSMGDMGLGALIGRSSVGPFMFHGVCLLLLLGIIMILPGMAAVSIVGEREKQTLRLVQVTTLSPRQIVTGKLVAALGYIGWLVAAVLPVLAAPMLIGGVRMGDVFGALLMLGLIATLIGAFSIWLSARSRSTRTAVAGSYLLTFTLLFLTPLLAVGEAFVQTDQFRRPPNTELWSLLPNPYVTLVSAVAHPLEVDGNGGGVQTPFYPGYEFLLTRENLSTTFGQGIPANRIVEEDGRRLVRPSRPPLWILSGLIYLGVIALAIRRASRWVTTPSPSEFTVKRTR
ncbi:MAG: ABC transporter permease subunit [Acidimicrobiia bacterium]